MLWTVQEVVSRNLSLLALAGCIEFGLDPIDDETPPRTLVVVTEPFVQAPLPSVDVLFVVDGSLSMAQELEALAEGIGEMLSVLDSLGVSWQIGTVEAASFPDASGRLRGQPWVLTPQTEDVVERFGDAMPSGSPGAGEAGILAGIAALDASIDGLNQGFRRPGAALKVIFVSDADDASDALLDDDAVQRMLGVLADEAARYGAPATASALVGDTPSGCSSVRGTAQAGTRYHAVALESGGTTHSICAADLGAALTTVGQDVVLFPDRFVLSQEPATDFVRVQVDGVVVDGWSLERDPSAIRFEVAPPPGAVIEVSYSVANTQEAQ